MLSPLLVMVWLVKQAISRTFVFQPANRISKQPGCLSENERKEPNQ